MWNKIGKFRRTFKPKITALDVNKKILTIPKEKAEAFADFYSEQFRCHPLTEQRSTMCMEVQTKIFETSEEYDSLFTKQELQLEIKDLNNTSPGDDIIENIF